VVKTIHIKEWYTHRHIQEWYTYRPHWCIHIDTYKSGIHIDHTGVYIYSTGAGTKIDERWR